MWPNRHRLGGHRKERSAKSQVRSVQGWRGSGNQLRRSPRTVIFLQNRPKSVQAVLEGGLRAPRERAGSIPRGSRQGVRTSRPTRTGRCPKRWAPRPETISAPVRIPWSNAAFNHGAKKNPRRSSTTLYHEPTRNRMTAECDFSHLCRILQEPWEWHEPGHLPKGAPVKTPERSDAEGGLQEASACDRAHEGTPYA